MTLSFIIAPLIGGVIGYITNDLAIRMLFRPHHAKYIGKLHIPLTPGIIPKEKGRIADSIGGVISDNLMSNEVLGKYLLSDSMTEKVTNATWQFLNSLKQNDESVLHYLCHFFSESEVRVLASNINDNLSAQVHDKLSDSELSKYVSHIAVETVIRKLKDEDHSDMTNSLGGGVFASVGKKALGSVLSLLQEPTERLLDKSIHDMLTNNSKEIVSNLINSQIESFLERPVRELLEGKEEQLEKVVDVVKKIYIQVIEEHLPKILESVDITKIVRDRINEMDVAEAEQLIMQVMKKELKAIVWLGACLGFLMGFINVII